MGPRGFSLFSSPSVALIYVNREVVIAAVPTLYFFLATYLDRFAACHLVGDSPDGLLGNRSTPQGCLGRREGASRERGAAAAR